MKGNVVFTRNLSDTGNISSTGSITGHTGSFTGSNTSQILNITQNGGGNAVNATATAIGAVGVHGTGGFSGVAGLSMAETVSTEIRLESVGWRMGPQPFWAIARPTLGWGTSSSNDGVHGDSVSGNGVAGFSQTGGAGVYGNGGTGVAGASSSSSGPGGNFTGFTAPFRFGFVRHGRNR